MDHPIDLANKYLHHSFVESSDLMNIYNGMATLDVNGEADIDFPDWFTAFNKDFRYQLTAVGPPGPNLHIAEELLDTTIEPSSSRRYNSNSRFRIACGTSGMNVSWQVTGIRRDPWANANRIQVEEEKPNTEQDYLIYPDFYGKSVEYGLNYLLSKRVKVAGAAHKLNNPGL
jgi:hypothetical protein